MDANLIYVAYGDHERLACKSAESFKRQNPELFEKIILLKPSNKIERFQETGNPPNPFTESYYIPTTVGGHLSKAECLHEFITNYNSSKTKCLFVDTDTACLAPIDHMLSILEHTPVAAAIAPYYHLDSFVGGHLKKVYPETFQNHEGLTCYNSGVILFDGSHKKTSKLFLTWLEFAKNGASICQSDQGYFSLSCLLTGIIPYPLLPNYNFRNNGIAFGKIYIHHSYLNPPQRRDYEYPGLLFQDKAGYRPLSLTFLSNKKINFILSILERLFNRLTVNRPGTIRKTSAK